MLIRFPKPTAKGNSVEAKRYLVVTADDYGIGPETSRGILELAIQNRLTSAVLLVNSPYAEEAVRAWRRVGTPAQLGWHPNLTIDRPILSARKINSLIRPDGCFWPLGQFICRLALGLVRDGEIAAELRAQRERFHDLMGHGPRLVNSHQHVSLFPPVGRILHDLLRRSKPIPYVRRVTEPLSMLRQIRGARIKRTALSLLGSIQARELHRAGFPGNDWLAGITDPPYVANPNHLNRWITLVPGQVVELACHPGYYDSTLVGRDCSARDGRLERRVHELHLMREPSYLQACRQAGFTLVSPTFLMDMHPEGLAHVA